MQFVRLLLAGVFGGYPSLQIILGYWGEVVPLYLDWLASLGQAAKLQRSIADYFRSNRYAPTPYQYRPGQLGLRFVQEAALSGAEQELFAQGNRERLTRA